MSSRLSVGALTLVITASFTLAQAAEAGSSLEEASRKAADIQRRAPRTVVGLGATVESVLAIGRELNPSLRAAALESSAAAAKAVGADKLDDPTISDSYQFYRNPNVFSGHSVMVTQAIPLWGKRDLRRDAAIADLEAARGREQAARDALDERIKVAFAQYYATSQALAVNQSVIGVMQAMRTATEARYAAGTGDQASVIRVLGEETQAKIDRARLEGDLAVAREALNALMARPPGAPLATPIRLRGLPGGDLSVAALLERARAGSPSIATSGAEANAARSRAELAERAWYPDITVGAGPLIQTNNRPTGVAATVGLNIPVPWGKEASEQDAAEAQAGAAEARLEAAVLGVQSALAEARERLKAARSAEALVARKALPEAQAGLKSMLAEYAQGRGDLAAVLESQHRVHDLELKLLQIRVDAQVALAGIERLIGGNL